MSTRYTLKEVCAWSVTEVARAKGIVEHRYVEIHSGTDGSRAPQVIELPTTEAVHLCGSMGSPTFVREFLSEFQFKGDSRIPRFAGIALPMAAQFLADHNQGLDDKDRISITIAMNPDGSFRVYGGPGRETDYFVNKILEKVSSQLDL